MVRRGQLVLDSTPVVREYSSYDLPPRVVITPPEEQDAVVRKYVTHHYHGDMVTPNPLDRVNLD